MNRSRVTGDLVSQNNIFVDIANDRVGIGSTIPTQKLEVTGTVKATAFSGDGSSLTGIDTDLVSDTSPQLGGSLDVNGQDIISTSNGDIDFTPNGTGAVVFKGVSGNGGNGAGRFKLNCEVNSHGITIQGPPHSAGATYTLTLPNNDGNNGEFLQTNGSGVLSFASADVVADTSPQLGGNLDVQSNEITTSTTNGNVKLNPNGTGVIEIKGSGTGGTLQLNCEANSHGIKLKSPPHSAAASYTLTFPNSIVNNGALKTDSSGNLSFGLLATSNIADNAISRPKIQDNAINTDKITDSSITSAKILNDSIVNADINASAAIDGTKISPAFTSDISITNTSPTISFVDSNHNPDYMIRNADGALIFNDTTNGANRLVINTDGHVDVVGNLDVGAGIDVTGLIDSTGNLKITNNNPTIFLIDSNANSDFAINVNDGEFRIQDHTNALSTRLSIASDGKTTYNTTGQIAAEFNTSHASAAYHDYKLGASGARIGYIGAGSQLVTTSGNTDFAIRAENTFVIGTNGNNERLRISSNGKITAGGSTKTTTGLLLLDKNLTAENNATAPNNYHLVIRSQTNSNTSKLGIGFANTTDDDKIGAAILHHRTGGGSVGDLAFYTSGSDGTITRRLLIGNNGNITANYDGSSATGQFQIADGTESSPGLTFWADGSGDTGIFRSGANTLNFSTGGTERLKIDSAGNTTITGDLQVDGSGTSVTIKPTDGLINFGMDGRTSFVTSTNACYIYSGSGASGAIPAGTLVLQSRSNVNRDIVMVTGTTPTQRLRIASDGNIAVGDWGTDSIPQLLSLRGSMYLRQGDLITWNNGDCDIGGISGFHLRFRTYDGSTMRERLRIKSGGDAHFSSGIFFSGSFNAADNNDYGRLNVLSGNVYGTSIQHSTNVVLTNEQGQTTQAMVLGDTSSGTNSKVLWGVSVNDSTSDPTTGSESGWSEKARVEGNGDFVISGGLSASGSDDRLKKNKVGITSALSKVCAMEGFIYEWNDVAEKIGMTDGEKHLGLSAQTVEPLVPEVVVINDSLVNHDDGTNDYKTIQYERLVPLLVEAIKDLKTENDSLKTRISALEGS